MEIIDKISNKISKNKDYFNVNATQIFITFISAYLLTFVSGAVATLIATASVIGIWSLFHYVLLPEPDLEKSSYSIIRVAKLFFILVGAYMVMLSNKDNLSLYSAIIVINLFLLVPTNQYLKAKVYMGLFLGLALISGFELGYFT